MSLTAGYISDEQYRRIGKAFARIVAHVPGVDKTKGRGVDRDVAGMIVKYIVDDPKAVHVFWRCSKKMRELLDPFMKTKYETFTFTGLGPEQLVSLGSFRKAVGLRLIIDPRTLKKAVEPWEKFPQSELEISAVLYLVKLHYVEVNKAKYDDVLENAKARGDAERMKREMKAQQKQAVNEKEAHRLQEYKKHEDTYVDVLKRTLSECKTKKDANAVLRNVKSRLQKEVQEGVNSMWTNRLATAQQAQDSAPQDFTEYSGNDVDNDTDDDDDLGDGEDAA